MYFAFFYCTRGVAPAPRARSNPPRGRGWERVASSRPPGPESRGRGRARTFFFDGTVPPALAPGPPFNSSTFPSFFHPPPHPLSEGAPFYLLCSLLTRSSRSFGKAGRRRGPRFPLIRGNRAPFPPCNRPVRRTSNRRANIVVRSCRA